MNIYETLRFIKLDNKTQIATQKKCEYVLSLLANSGAESHNGDMTWDSNEMCLQGLNLSSTEESAYHHDSALLQPSMNTEEIYSPRK